MHVKNNMKDKLMKSNIKDKLIKNNIKDKLKNVARLIFKKWRQEKL